MPVFTRKKQMTPDSTESTSTGRPKSSLAQTVTAWATAAVAVALGGLVVAGGALLTAAENSLNHFSETSTASSAVTQWLCLPYTQFVLEQHRAGLTPEQIAGALEVSEYKRGGQLGVSAPVTDIDGPRLDSTDACGLPFEIIDAVAPAPTPVPAP